MLYVGTSHFIDHLYNMRIYIEFVYDVKQTGRYLTQPLIWHEVLASYDENNAIAYSIR